MWQDDETRAADARAASGPRHAAVMVTRWVTTTDRNGRRCYVTPAGSIVSRDGVGRTPVTVLYPGHTWTGAGADYGMTDTVAEGKAWAEIAEAAR